MTDVKEDQQFVIDLPEIEPKITRNVIESGYCIRCGRHVRSRHPDRSRRQPGRRV